MYDVPATADEREIELETRTFAERIVVPTFNRAAAAVAARTPEKQRQSLTYTLDLAGHPGNWGPDEFVIARIALGITLFLAGLLVGFLFQNPLIEAIGPAVGGAIGYMGPVLWLRQKISARRQQIQRALPDVMDLLTISVEAGLSFDSAVQRVVAKFKNPLSDEMKTMQQEVQLGRPRLEALDALGRRCGVEDLHNFVQAVIQSEQMGVGITRLLRLQSDEIRRRRRQRAQEKAAQATLKMMLPMVGCIFPTLWIVLLGPAIIILIKRGG
jgi:tight adherence protein C